MQIRYYFIENIITFMYNGYNEQTQLQQVHWFLLIQKACLCVCMCLCACAHECIMPHSVAVQYS